MLLLNGVIYTDKPFKIYFLYGETWDWAHMMPKELNGKLKLQAYQKLLEKIFYLIYIYVCVCVCVYVCVYIYTHTYLVLKQIESLFWRPVGWAQLLWQTGWLRWGLSSQPPSFQSIPQRLCHVPSHQQPSLSIICI